MLIIYNQIGIPNKQINIYDGLNVVSTYFNNGITPFTINNLSVVDNQNAKMTYVSYNGSPNQNFNESITLNGNLLSNSLNPPDNPFNGTNSFTGSTTNWNQDIDTFDITSYITIGDTQATITLSSIPMRAVQTLVTSIRSELPDATVQINLVNGQQTCNNRDLVVNYKVSNTNSNANLAIVPVSFYANNVLLQTVNTTASVPIGGSLALQSTVTIPAGIPNTFDLKVVVDNSATNTSTVAESNENNNEAVQSITLAGNTITPTFTAVNPICAGATLLALPTTSNNNISGTWSPVLNNQQTTTYTFTPSSGQCATNQPLTITVNSLVVPTFTAVNPICAGATLLALPTTSNNNITGIWSPALNNQQTTTYTFTPTAGQCATSQTLSIAVNPLVVPTFTAVNPICAGATLVALPTTSNNNISGTWSPTLNNQQTTTYTFTPNAGQCATSQTLQIIVNPLIVPTFTAVNPICAGATLLALATTSDNNISGTWSPALNNQQTTTYTFTPKAGQCATSQTLQIIVNPLVIPTFTAVNPICAGATLSALPTSSNNNIAGTWSPALNNQQTTTYTFTPTAGQCATNQTLQIIVNSLVVATFTAVNPICSGATLSALPTTSSNNISGTWSPALNNLQTTTYTFTPTAGQCATGQTLSIAVNPLIVPTFTAVNPICVGATLLALPTTSNNNISGTWSPALNNQQTTTYTFTASSGQCATSQTLVITIQNPTIVSENLSICNDSNGGIIAPVVLNTKLSSSLFSFVWTKNNLPVSQTTASISVVAIGNYQVIATPIGSGCQQIFNFNVTDLQPLIIDYNIGADFSDNQIITITASGGSGQYLYSFDNQPFGGSNIYEVENGGEILIKVIDNSTCYESINTITAWQYPKFFTPNNDGFNDTWSIKTNKKIKVDIFDRFGKLIYQLTNNKSWDGTLEGLPLPSTDYWFGIYYSENKFYKGHFALNR